MRFVDSLRRDLLLAARGLLRDRGFTATALLTFALCLGANVALFAVVNAVLVRPLPYPQPDRLVAVYNAYPKAGVDRAGTTVPHYLERRSGIAAFADAAAFRGDGVTIGDSGSPDRVESMRVTPSFFRVLGAQAALGRTFTEEEGVYGKDNVIVLSDALWRKNFAADPAVIGRSVRLGGAGTSTVVGVMPAGFRFANSDAVLWTPLCFSDDDRKPEQRHSNNMAMIARLQPGVTLAAAQAQIDALNAEVAPQDPYAQLVAGAGFRTTVADLHTDLTQEIRPLLLLLQAGVLFLLVIGAVNLANLLLVRASTRTKEISIRRVLGAGHGAIARQLITETVLLAFVGGLLGLALGWAGLRGLELIGAEQLPHSSPFTLDATVCTVALGAAVLVGLLLALPVLWHCLHGNLASALAVESRGGTTSRATHRLRHTLIVAQFALAFVLLAGAGLLGLSFVRVLQVAPGFEATQVLTGAVPLPYANYKEAKQRVAFTERFLQEVRNLPGVVAVGCSSMLPFTGNIDQNGISIEGRVPSAEETLQAHFTGSVTGDFFAALGIPLRAGRLINADDTARESRTCVVDEEFARRYWPQGDALGHRLWLGPPDKPEEAFEIVGVVGAIKQNDLAERRAVGAVYLPYARYASFAVSFVVRTAQPPAAAGPALRAAVLRIDPDLPVDDLQTMASRIDESLLERRSPLLLAALFAGVALVLAGVGLYGVLAYAVAQRRREVGVRLALGARPQQIRTQFLALGVRLVALGIVLGGLGAWLTGRAMQSLLFGVGAVDPLVFATAAGVLSAIALAACLLPSLRASRVHPMEALRSD